MVVNKFYFVDLIRFQFFHGIVKNLRICNGRKYHHFFIFYFIQRKIFLFKIIKISFLKCRNRNRFFIFFYFIYYETYDVLFYIIALSNYNFIRSFKAAYRFTQPTFWQIFISAERICSIY